LEVAAGAWLVFSAVEMCVRWLPVQYNTVVHTCLAAGPSAAVSQQLTKSMQILFVLHTPAEASSLITPA
jgi:hypothetical protein